LYYIDTQLSISSIAPIYITQSAQLSIKTKLDELLKNHKTRKTDAQEVLEVLTGWNAYAMSGNTYRLRESLTNEIKKELASRKMATTSLSSE